MDESRGGQDVGEFSRFSFRRLSAAAAFLLILYVLSVGPVAAASRRGEPVMSQEALEIVYAPIIWAYDHTPFTSRWIGISNAGMGVDMRLDRLHEQLIDIA